MGRNDILDPSPLPFLADPNLRLLAAGSWNDGGILEIHVDEFRLDVLELSANEWSILALLMEAAKQSASLHWATAFRTTLKLSREMQSIAHRGVSTDADIHRGIHKLRKSLDGSKAARMQSPDRSVGGTSWSWRVVERHRKMGYRISLPPSQMLVHLVKDDD